MKPTIIVDANPIISALIGGFSREILFDHHFAFVTTHFTIEEVLRYLPYIAKKSGVPIHFVQSLLDLLPIQVYTTTDYATFRAKAKTLINDSNDIELLALALRFGFPVWSNDADFEGINEITLIKTKDFI